MTTRVFADEKGQTHTFPPFGIDTTSYTTRTVRMKKPSGTVVNITAGINVLDNSIGLFSFNVEAADLGTERGEFLVQLKIENSGGTLIRRCPIQTLTVETGI